MAKHERSDPRSRFHVDYWQDRLYQKTFFRRGKKRVVAAWSVRFQHLGRREAFSLGSANKSAAKCRSVVTNFTSREITK